MFYGINTDLFSLLTADRIVFWVKRTLLLTLLFPKFSISDNVSKLSSASWTSMKFFQVAQNTREQPKHAAHLLFS